MSIRIIKPGVDATVQDAGRARFLDQAVPLSGVMDRSAATLANLLVGNEPDAGLIEIVDGNFECVTQANVLLALVAGSAKVEINGQAAPINRPMYLPNNSRLHLKNNVAGRYAYLAIAGGWEVPQVLGSKSTFVTAMLGGHQGRCLKKDDELEGAATLSTQAIHLCQYLKSDVANWPAWSIPPEQLSGTDSQKLRVIMGREFDWFEDKTVADFLSKSYQFTSVNRMGARLQGPVVTRKPTHQSELLSTAVVPGTIQVTGDGSLILLLADCQTTGGYPRLAKVAEVDLPICAQCKPGQPLHFERINLEEAEKLYLDREKEFQKLATAIQLKIESYNASY